MQPEPDAFPESFNAAQKVQILMHEYNNLRTQIIHRTNDAVQFVTASGARKDCAGRWSEIQECPLILKINV